MSIFYKKGNNESTKALYQKSLIYRSDILDPEYENLKDFQLAEKYLYGRVSYGYVPIELDLPSTSMGSLDQTNKLGTGFQAVRTNQNYRPIFVCARSTKGIRKP